MSASRQQFQYSDSDSSCDPPTPTEGTTYVHNLNKRRHTRIDPRKRHANTIHPPNHDLPINKEDDESNYEPIDAFDCDEIKNMLYDPNREDSYHESDRECLTDTPLSLLRMEPCTYALHIILTIPWMVNFIMAQPRGGPITDAVQDVQYGSLTMNEFDDMMEKSFLKTTCKKIYPSCTHIRIHSSLIPPLQHLSKLVGDTNEIYLHLLNMITRESEKNSPIILKLNNGEEPFIIHKDVMVNISNETSLGCEHSPHCHILTECVLKATCNTLPIILNVSIQRNDVNHLTLPTDVAHTTPTQKMIFEKTLTLSSNNRTLTYTLRALKIRNDGENNHQHPQTIINQQNQWVIYNNDQTILPISKNIFQDENIQQQVILLVYEVNDTFNMKSSLHSIDNSHPEHGDVKERHLQAANVLVDLNRNTEKETEKLQKQDDDRPAKKRRNIIITSTMQSPMPSQAKNILFTTTKPRDDDTDSLFSLDMSLPRNKEKAAFIRSNIPRQYWIEKTENNHVIFHFGDEIIPVAIHIWDEEKAKRDETSDIPQLMEKYIQVMLIR
ncbi:MAG: hypothetical protein ACKOBX_07235 [Bacteroidota bacterium]